MDENWSAILQIADSRMEAARMKKLKGNYKMESDEEDDQTNSYKDNTKVMQLLYFLVNTLYDIAGMNKIDINCLNRTSQH